jgi:uncharacterized protein DUF5684
MWQLLNSVLLQEGFTQMDYEMEGPGAVFWIVVLGCVVLAVAGMWKTFAKAGKPGWAAIVPIYNVIVLLEITGKPIWWIILFLIPLVSIIVSIMVYHALSKSFGRGVGTTLGLIFLSPIFFAILGFGDAQYTKPSPAM